MFVGVVGEDEAGAKLRAELAREPGIEAHLVVDPARPTTRKVRFVSEHFSTHLLRADWELAAPVAAKIEAELIDADPAAACTRRHGGAVGLRQGRADAAGDARR